MFRLADVQLVDGTVWQCYAPGELAIHVKDLCVVDDRHVLEYGRITKLTEVRQDHTPKGTMPAVIRRATLQDQSRARENAAVVRTAQEACRKRVAELKLSMHIIHVRYSFDRSVLTLTFTAEDRVDFRELVKLLSGDLKARVEMEQIGVRDAARFACGMASCGRPMCCGTWIKNFEAVGVKMAKLQKLSLNPNAISGMCGRLKCCLRYEFDGYRQMTRDMPREKARVQSPEGPGIVLETCPLKHTVKVGLADHRVFEFDASEVKELSAPAPGADAGEEDEVLE